MEVEKGYHPEKLDNESRSGGDPGRGELWLGAPWEMALRWCDGCKPKQEASEDCEVQDAKSQREEGKWLRAQLGGFIVQGREGGCLGASCTCS